VTKLLHQYTNITHIAAAAFFIPNDKNATSFSLKCAVSQLRNPKHD